MELAYIVIFCQLTIKELPSLQKVSKSLWFGVIIDDFRCKQMIEAINLQLIAKQQYMLSDVFGCKVTVIDFLGIGKVTLYHWVIPA